MKNTEPLPTILDIRNVVDTDDSVLEGFPYSTQLNIV